MGIDREINFIPWEQSVTNVFLPDVLNLLKDGDIDTVVDYVLERKDKTLDGLAIKELAGHGNYQRAKMLMQELVRIGQEHYDAIRRECDPLLVNDLWYGNVMKLPKN